jgi:hypothetical protein
MTVTKYELNEAEIKTYEEWFMFSVSSGIGIAAAVERRYSNGDIRDYNLTDYNTW